MLLEWKALNTVSPLSLILDRPEDRIEKVNGVQEARDMISELHIAVKLKFEF